MATATRQVPRKKRTVIRPMMDRQPMPPLDSTSSTMNFLPMVVISYDELGIHRFGVVGLMQTLKEKIVEILKPGPPPWYEALRKAVVDGVQEAVGPTYRVYTQPRMPDGFSVYIEGNGWLFHTLTLKDREGVVLVEGCQHFGIFPKEQAEEAVFNALREASLVVRGCQIAVI